MGSFKIGKGAHQGCILSPCLFNLYAEYTGVSQVALVVKGPPDNAGDPRDTEQKVKGN